MQKNSYSGSGLTGTITAALVKISITANSVTFLMINMMPQAPCKYQKTRESFESYLRAQLLKGYEVYVVMASYGTGGIGLGKRMGGEYHQQWKVAGPANTCKVPILLKTRDNGQTLFLRIENTSIT